MLAVVLLFAVVCTVMGKHGEPVCENLVRPHGLPCETHSVETEDGYINQLIHLPNPGKPPIYLQHGLMDSTATFMNQAVNFSLGSFLWRRGYDVWAGDSRGNWYSLRNRKYPPTSKEFWQGVDWDMMAKYDLPAFLTYVLDKTHHKKLVYVGHSQGTSQVFAALAANYGSVREQIGLFGALAPVTYLKHTTSKLLKDLAALHVDNLFGIFGGKSFPPKNLDGAQVLAKVHMKCPEPKDTLLCENILYDMEGASVKYLNKSVWENLLGFDTAGTSMHNLRHYLEAFRHDRFAMYGYGWLGNLEHYGTLYPPKYDLSKIPYMPTLLAIGGKDEFTAAKDITHFLADYPSANVLHKEMLPNFQHLDFVWSEEAPTAVYTPLAKFLDEHIHQML